jgi:adenosylhomocysteine nucleosidase
MNLFSRSSPLAQFTPWGRLLGLAGFIFALALNAARAEQESAAPAGATSAAAPAAEQTPLIAVLNAYAPEMDAMVKEFGLLEGGFKEKRVKGFRYYIGKVEGKDVVVFETGMSLVNAAMALQLALERLPISHVLFAGVAGGTDPSLHVGDVVIPEKWAYHCEAAYFNPRPDGTGWMKADYFEQRYPNFGMIFPDDMQAIRADKEKFERMAFFPVDPTLMEVARRAVDKLGPIKSERTGREITVSLGGAGVTGTVFLDNRDYRKFVHQTWGARCTDMETTAYAHVCYTNEIPFLAVRALSDLAGGQEEHEVNAIDANEHTSSVHAVRVLRAILREM